MKTEEAICRLRAALCQLSEKAAISEPAFLGMGTEIRAIEDALESNAVKLGTTRTQLCQEMAAHWAYDDPIYEEEQPSGVNPRYPEWSHLPGLVAHLLCNRFLSSSIIDPGSPMRLISRFRHCFSGNARSLLRAEILEIYRDPVGGGKVFVRVRHDDAVILSALTTAHANLTDLPE
jgi:hypothetical protein